MSVSRLLPFLALAALAGATGPEAAAQKARPARDAAPVLISTDAGPRWKNVTDLRRYAELGDAQAQFELGERLLNGDGVTVDPKEARVWLERAGAQEMGDALFRLGKIYHDGLGTPRDFPHAFHYYTRAARLGVPEAQHNVGAMLVSARGVKRDYVEGLAWLIVATKSGAVSTAEQQTRERLARRPADIARAEARAKEILAAMKDPKAEVAPVATTVDSGADTPAVTRPSSVPARGAPPPKAEVGAPKVAPPKVELAPPALTVPPPKIEPPKPEPGE